MSGPDVVVVGGGIAGLGAARTLTQHGLEVVVLEREAEAGGRMRSRQGWDGLWFDIGAEQLTSRDVPFLEMIDEFGLTDQKIGYLSETGTAFQIFKDGESYELDMVRPRKLLTYGAMSPWGRAQLVRMVPAMIGQMRRNRGTTFEPWRAAPLDDQSMEEWLGRIAPQFLEYAMEPMWDIVCGWDPADVSRGFLVYIMTAYRNATGLTLKTGLGAITRALSERLDVRTGTTVTRVDVNDRAVEYEPAGGGPSQRVTPDAVLVAVPGHKVQDITTGLDPERAEFFAGVRYQAHDNCYFKLDEKADELDLPNRGHYPRREHGELSGIGYGVVPTAPDHKVLRAGLKGRFSTQYAGRPDAEFEAAIMQRVAEVAPQIPPLVVDRFMCRWDAALPIFYTGYLRALGRFHAMEPLPGVAFAGDYLSLCATAAAYDSGQRAAGQISSDLGRG